MGDHASLGTIAAIWALRKPQGWGAELIHYRWSAEAVAMVAQPGFFDYHFRATPNGLTLSHAGGPEMLLRDATPQHAEMMRQLSEPPLSVRTNETLDNGSGMVLRMHRRAAWIGVGLLAVSLTWAPAGQLRANEQADDADRLIEGLKGVVRDVADISRRMVATCKAMQPPKIDNCLSIVDQVQDRASEINTLADFVRARTYVTDPMLHTRFVIDFLMPRVQDMRKGDAESQDLVQHALASISSPAMQGHVLTYLRIFDRLEPLLVEAGEENVNPLTGERRPIPR
jgi:hypothetical protein